MKGLVKGFVLAALALATAGAQAADEKDGAALKPATEGAEVGQWTQDWDAAKKLAKEKNLPIILNFTGSDWCGWCKLMGRQVFSKQEWQDYAKDKLVLVWLDFPQNKSLVPEKYVARNKQLSEQFGVEGYPTYIVLQSDGATKLGKLGASREATAKGFISDLEKLTVRPAKIAKLDAAKKAAYDKAVAAKAAVEKEKAELDAKVKEYFEGVQKQFQDIEKRMEAAEGEIDKIFE
jgi:thiol:disulfide interchange protein